MNQKLIDTFTGLQTTSTFSKMTRTRLPPATRPRAPGPEGDAAGEGDVPGDSAGGE